MTKEQLSAIFAQLRNDHADLWRTLSLSEEWRRLQALEAQLELLAALIRDAEQPVEEPHE